MSVLARFFELALVFTFMLFCVNGILLYFGDVMVPNPSGPVEDLTGDQNVFVDSNETGSYILQAATLGTAPTDVAYVGNAILTLAVGFELKLIAILSVYELTGIAYFISSILIVIRIIGIMYLVLALIGTPLGGSVP